MHVTDKHKNIITYYQSSQWMYRLFCYNARTLSMHFGLWNKTTKNRHEAMLNENLEVVSQGSIQSGMRVLDAGCGVGGSVLHIAEVTGAHVWGVSLDPKQIQTANQYAKKRNLTPLVHFSVQDYAKTNFPDNYFDVVYGLESICYADPKMTFLRETYRILKPGGKLIIHDGYCARVPITPKEKQILQDFTRAWALPTMLTNKTMTALMKQAGFVSIQSKNMMKQVAPSVRYFRIWGIIGKPVCLLSQYVPIESIHAIYRNYLAFKVTDDAYGIGLAEYWQQYGQKPLKNINRNIPSKRAK